LSSSIDVTGTYLNFEKRHRFWHAIEVVSRILPSCSVNNRWESVGQMIGSCWQVAIRFTRNGEPPLNSSTRLRSYQACGAWWYIGFAIFGVSRTDTCIPYFICTHFAQPLLTWVTQIVSWHILPSHSGVTYLERATKSFRNNDTYTLWNRPRTT